MAWIGSTNKYWMYSIIPKDEKLYDVNMKSTEAPESNIISLRCSEAQSRSIKPGQSECFRYNIFCGAKELDMLDQYRTEYNINLFDRAVDFGWLYFITKPMFVTMKFFNDFFKNFGITIIFLTVMIRFSLFPMLRKSEHNLSNMKKIQPKIDALKKKYPNNSNEFRQHLLELYSKENINPLSFSLGCLPILLQMPIFYAFLVVLQVAIDLRHSPFLLWIQDLSEPDNLYIFNLLGLIDLNLPEFLKIGILPILCGISLYVQQKISPQILDPVQQKIFRFFPIVFIFLFSNSPSGLLVYCITNNLLSVLQQLVTRYYNKKTALVKK